MDDTQATSWSRSGVLAGSEEVGLPASGARRCTLGSRKRSCGSSTRAWTNRTRTGAAVHLPDDGIESSAGHALDCAATLHRTVKAVVYQRTKFAKRYTAADLVLLAYVDKAHGNLSGPATRRILEREYSQYNQAAYQRLAAISVAHLYRLRNSEAIANAMPATSRRDPHRFPSANGASRSAGLARIPALDTVHQGDWRTQKGCITSMSSTSDAVEIIASTPQISNSGCCQCWKRCWTSFPL